MKKTDLLVIGGSAGGILCATTARKAYGDIDITVMRETETVMVPCGIPYIYGTLHSTKKNVIPDSGLLDANINLIIDSAIEIDRPNKTVITEKNGVISYKKLVIATGSLPVIPTFIPGYELDNVFPVFKDEVHLNKVLEKLDSVQNVVIIGCGFIGVEFAEQIKMLGKNVTLVEMADACLWQAFDKEFTDDLEQLLAEKGIRVMTRTKVKRILGKTVVEGIELEDGRKIPTEMVVLGLGAKPNSKLAKSCGLEVNSKGAIQVDQYMRTNDPDIFSVGDCAEKKCFFTGKNVSILLASTAAMEAKIAGCNLFQLGLIRTNKGTISAFSTKVFGKTYAAAGLTEGGAKKEGFAMMIGEFKTMDRHPSSLPDAQTINMKLIFSKGSGNILGAQVSGGNSVAEIINILSLAIQKNMTVTELNTFQTATHPLGSASPIAYPINAAAMNVISNLNIK